MSSSKTPEITDIPDKKDIASTPTTTLLARQVDANGSYTVRVEFGLTKQLPNGNNYEFLKFNPHIEFKTSNPEEAFQAGYTFLNGVVIEELKKWGG